MKALENQGLIKEREVQIHLLRWCSVGESNYIRNIRSMRTSENQGCQTRYP